MAAFWFSFQCCATSLASGSSGFGAPRRAWIESSIVRICSAGDQLPLQCENLCPSSKAGQLTLQNVQAYPTELVNIRMVYFGQEANLWGSHGIVVREKKLELEDSTYEY